MEQWFSQTCNRNKPSWSNPGYVLSETAGERIHQEQYGPVKDEQRVRLVDAQCYDIVIANSSVASRLNQVVDL